MAERRSGVLMHVSSFPSQWGSGDFGPEAYRFIDWLESTEQTLWQILPLTYPDNTGSPYTSLSANAIYFQFLNPEMLWTSGYISDEERNTCILARNAKSPDARGQAMSFAFEKWKRQEDHSDFDIFCKTHEYWLHDTALFMTIHDRHAGTWYDFPSGLRDREPAAIEEWETRQSDAILRFKFEQYILFSQWQSIKDYANAKGIQVIGDIPIFISGDSADVWAHRDLFKLNDEGYPLVWTGVPPDLFTKTGQLWAQPHYDWEAMRRNNFTWWVERTRVGKIHADIIRIDHFRGFCAAYEVEYGAPNAIKGKWVDGPRAEIFKVLQDQIPDLYIIAEDLGVITPDVIALRRQFNYPGMKILQFAFNGGHDHDFLPQNYDPKDRYVVYTGTHDNNTTRGWFKHATKHEKYMLSQYCDPDPDRVVWCLIDMAFRSNAMWAVIPLQDLLGLGEEARMNLPGTIVNNWIWQLEQFSPPDDLTGKLRQLTINSGRGRS
jgi:4-alpha-glucanotransferase